MKKFVNTFFAVSVIGLGSSAFATNSANYYCPATLTVTAVQNEDVMCPAKYSGGDGTVIPQTGEADSIQISHDPQTACKLKPQTYTFLSAYPIASTEDRTKFTTGCYYVYEKDNTFETVVAISPQVAPDTNNGNWQKASEYNKNNLYGCTGSNNLWCPFKPIK